MAGTSRASTSKVLAGAGEPPSVKFRRTLSSKLQPHSRSAGCSPVVRCHPHHVIGRESIQSVRTTGEPRVHPVLSFHQGGRSVRNALRTGLRWWAGCIDLHYTAPSQPHSIRPWASHEATAAAISVKCLAWVQLRPPTDHLPRARLITTDTRQVKQSPRRLLASQPNAWPITPRYHCSRLQHLRPVCPYLLPAQLGRPPLLSRDGFTLVEHLPQLHKYALDRGREGYVLPHPGLKASSKQILLFMSWLGSQGWHFQGQRQVS